MSEMRALAAAVCVALIFALAVAAAPASSPPHLVYVLADGELRGSF